MRLVNTLNSEIMYSLNKDKFKNLEPNGFIFVPDTCRKLQIKPTDEVYTLSIDQLNTFPLGEVENIILTDNINRAHPDNSVVIEEQKPNDMNWFLKFLYRNSAGMGERIYVPKFDLTTYDFDKKPEVTTIDNKKVIDKLTKMTTDRTNSGWWFILIFMLIIIMVIPLVIILFFGNTDDMS